MQADFQIQSCAIHRKPLTLRTIAMKPKDSPLGDFDLENALPYLLNRAGVRIGLAFSQEIKRYKVTLPMFRILASLVHFERQSLTELAEHTTVELSTLSRLAATMQRRGLVSRARSGADGRSISITLTAAGMKLARELIPLAELYERVALFNLPPEEVALLKRLLKQIYSSVRNLGPKTPRNRR
jgi:DNA-binding MarR family transcriptional regulator